MSLLNLTDNLSIFSITENKIDVSSCLLSNRDDSEIWPNLTEIGEFQDIFQNSDDIQRIDNVIYIICPITIGLSTSKCSNS